MRIDVILASTWFSIELQVCLVCGGVVGIAAATAKIEEQASGWPDLWLFVAAASSGPHPDARKLAFCILSETIDTIGVHLGTQFQHLSGSLFLRACRRPNIWCRKRQSRLLVDPCRFLRTNVNWMNWFDSPSCAWRIQLGERSSRFGGPCDC